MDGTRTVGEKFGGKNRSMVSAEAGELLFPNSTAHRGRGRSSDRMTSVSIHHHQRFIISGVPERCASVVLDHHRLGI